MILLINSGTREWHGVIISSLKSRNRIVPFVCACNSPSSCLRKQKKHLTALDVEKKCLKSQGENSGDFYDYLSWTVQTVSKRLDSVFVDVSSKLDSDLCKRKHYDIVPARSILPFRKWVEAQIVSLFSLNKLSMFVNLNLQMIMWNQVF